MSHKANNNVLVELTGVSKSYGKQHPAVNAVNEVSFVVSRGERVALLGKSGSGKPRTTEALSRFAQVLMMNQVIRILGFRENNRITVLDAKNSGEVENV